MNNKNSLLTRFFILFIAMLMAALPTMHASAGLRSCRTDPIFWLSNGDKLTVILDISANAADLEEFNYVLHVPAGITVTKVVYTAKGSGIKETYQVVQDSTPNTYHTDILVTLNNKTSDPVAIVATAKYYFKDNNNAKDIKSASGYSGQSFRVTVSHP